MNEWFLTPLGEKIIQEFLEQFNLVKSYLKGERLVQLGSCADNPWLNELDFNHKWIISPLHLDANQSLQCSFNQIPLCRDSVDTVLVPLSMEPSSNYLTLIDEIDRILKPMGYVVFLSLNPWSLWGLALKLGTLDCYGNNKVNLHAPWRLNRTFVQRGFRQCSLNYFCYIPPINKPNTIKKLFFLEEIGKMIWPFPAGFYCYIAQKFEHISPSLVVHSVARPVAKDYEIPMQPVIS